MHCMHVVCTVFLIVCSFLIKWSHTPFVAKGKFRESPKSVCFTLRGQWISITHYMAIHLNVEIFQPASTDMAKKYFRAVSGFLSCIVKQALYKLSELRNNHKWQIVSAQMCLHSIRESHGKVMEFHIKATVGALLMFDMSSWVYFCPFSDKVPCALLIPLSLLLVSRLHFPFPVWNSSLCLFVSFSFPIPVFPHIFTQRHLNCFLLSFLGTLVLTVALIFCSPPAVQRSEQWFVYNVLLETGQK